jgi:hypothetical protein
MEFINHLLSFSAAINKIDLNKTSLNKIIWLEEKYNQHDYLDPFCDYFQRGLINAEKKVVRLIIDNFDQAIESQCGNNLDLSIYADDYYWDFRWDTNDDQQHLNKRYVITKLIPNDEKVLKELWLRNYITTLSKIIANIRKVTNNPKEVAIHKSGNLKKELPVKSTSLFSGASSLSFINTGFDESVKPKAKTNKPPKERKELYNNIFKENAFEVWQSMFEQFEIKESSYSIDLDFMFNVMQNQESKFLIHKNISKTRMIEWINEVYEITFTKIKYTNYKSNSNKNRLIIFNQITSK